MSMASGMERNVERRTCLTESVFQACVCGANRSPKRVFHRIARVEDEKGSIER